jgi:sugar phosphate isomerase/epimerase
MQTKFICTYWGCEGLSAKAFLDKSLRAGYDGVEINFPNDSIFVAHFIEELKRIRTSTHPDFIFIAQQVLDQQNETVHSYSQRLEDRLHFLIDLQPDAINSHTGKDFFDFDDNVNLLNTTEKKSLESGIPIWHEIHRGRFSFHLRTLLRYLELFPNLGLIADFSHFCVVSESDLSDQRDLLQQIFPNIRHTHARVGSTQSSQVIDPFNSEQRKLLDTYLDWWKRIRQHHLSMGKSQLTITPEFGPFPYLLNDPFSQFPMANQWDVNIQMKQFLTENLDK